MKTAARWLMLGAVVLAPWPYGCIPRWVQPYFTGWLLAATALWLLGLVVRRRWPALPPLLLGVAGLLLLQGWLLISNAQCRYDPLAFEFLPAHPWWRGLWAPGALDTAEAGPNMLRLTSLLGVLFVCADMARSPVWRRRLFISLMTGGTAVALHGIAQRVLHSPLGLWDETTEKQTYFASFYYHGNAGAFVNLIVPGLAAAALLSFRQPGHPVIRTLLGAALFLILVAAVAIASKAAMILTVGLLLATLFAFGRDLPRRARWTPGAFKTAGAVALVGACIPLLGFEHARQRWSELPALLNWHNPRLLAWRACLRMLPDAGPWGIGPGNFKMAFPHYTAGLGNEIGGFWEFAHQDYLQTAIEWGSCGFLLWALLFGGAFWPREQPGSGFDRAIRLSSLLAMAGLLLHATVDYPLQIPVIQLYAVAFLGILWSARQPVPARSFRESHLPA